MLDRLCFLDSRLWKRKRNETLRKTQNHSVRRARASLRTYVWASHRFCLNWCKFQNADTQDSCYAWIREEDRWLSPNLIVWCRFLCCGWPIQIVSWLGGGPMTHGDRRHGEGYIPHLSTVRDTTSLISTLSKWKQKHIVKMSPNVGFETLRSFSPRCTVAKRKEAAELRKVSKRFVVIYAFFDKFTLRVWNQKWILNSLCLPLDYETTDGEKKARPDQRQLEQTEKPYYSPHRQRCKLPHSDSSRNHFKIILK